MATKVTHVSYGIVELIPFNMAQVGRQECRKCGTSSSPRARYTMADTPKDRAEGKEWLELACNNCGHIVFMECKDAQP